MKIDKIYNQGFTIVETLVAITILMISIAGPLTIAQKSLTAATQAKDQVIASYLAQDLVEYIKNARDNALRGGTDFGGTNSFVSNFCTSVVTSCGSQKLYLTPSGAYTTQSNSTPSKFSRQATITPLSSNEAIIRVTVTWQNGPILNTSTVENILFNVTL